MPPLVLCIWKSPSPLVQTLLLRGERKRAVSRCSSPVPVNERRVEAEESMELAMLLPWSSAMTPSSTTLPVVKTREPSSFRSQFISRRKFIPWSSRMATLWSPVSSRIPPKEAALMVSTVSPAATPEEEAYTVSRSAETEPAAVMEAASPLRLRSSVSVFRETFPEAAREVRRPMASIPPSWT